MSGPGDTADPARRPGETRQLFVVGAALLGLRGVLVQALMAAGALALAQLLRPRDFGILALGLAITNSTRFLADAGIGAALIRQPADPEREDLRALLFVQLVVTVAVAAIGGAVALQFSTEGAVIAVMIASLPFAAFRTPGMVLAERRLEYRPVVWVETLEAVAFNLVAVGTVLAGAGLWGVAAATVARSVVGSVTMLLIGPARIVRPVPSWRRVRPLVAFGAQYQAVGLMNVIRDQGLAVGTAAIAGLSVLGLWGLAYRVFQIPLLAFSAVWRVSYPALARMRGAGEDLGPTLERATRNVAVPTGLLLVMLASGAPAAIPAVLGDVWREAADPLPFACLGLVMVGPVSVAAAGYLFAVGDAATVLRGAILHTIATLGVGLALLPFLGVVSLGVGVLASAVVEAVVLGRGTARQAGTRNLATVTIVPTLCAAAAGGAGWMVADRLGPTLPSALLAAGAAGALYVGLLGLIRPRLLRESWVFTSRAARRAF